MSEQEKKAVEVKRNYEKQWLTIRGVVAVGVGITEGRPGVIVSVDKSPDSVAKQIPEVVDGVKVVIRQTGEIKAQ